MRIRAVILVLLGLSSSGCSLIGLGIGAAVPKVSGESTQPAAASNGASEAPVVTSADGQARARFDTPADVADIKRAVCTLAPILDQPIAATIQEGGARTECGSDTAARHLDVRLKTYGASSVVVEVDRAHAHVETDADRALVAEAAKRIRLASESPHESGGKRIGSYWATGLGVGLVVDTLLLIAGVVVGVTMHNAASWGAWGGWGGWTGGM